MGHVLDKCQPYAGQTGKVTKSGNFKNTDGLQGSSYIIARVRVQSIHTVNLPAIEANY